MADKEDAEPSYSESDDEVSVEEEPPTDVTVSIGEELYRFTKVDSSLQFSALPETLQFFYHYITDACWCGSLIIFFQTSAESPDILLFLLKLFTPQSLSELETSSEENGVSQVDFGALVFYAARFFSVRGNRYESQKFFPRLPQYTLFTIMESSLAWSSENELMNALWKRVVIPMYAESPSTATHLTNPGEQEDARLVRQYLVSENIPVWNARFTKSLMRQGATFDIKLASVVEEEDAGYVLGPEMCFFKVTKGDYSFILKEVIRSLTTAKLYTADDLEKDIIDRYIASFMTGVAADHREGSSLWMNTDSQYAEWYLGFIELLRNPVKGFAEFQGFVGLLNSDVFQFYKNFLTSAGTLIHLLPWGKEYEMENFVTPKLITADLVMFCGHTVPALKNVPVYEEIRSAEGFKNVVFCNLIFNDNINIEEAFLQQNDVDILWKYANTAHKIHLGLKLVMGLGCGKLFRREGNNFNFPVRRMRHPILKDKIRTWYEGNETFFNKFGELSETLEECRALCIALYLSSYTEVMSLFDVPEEEFEDIIYAIWLWQVYSSVATSLHGYDAPNKQWFDPKAQANFVILRVLLEAEERVVHISEPEYGKRITIHVDRTKILTAGRRAVGDFVRKLHIFKCTADVTSARKLYDRYSVVPEEGRYPLGRWDVLTAETHSAPVRMFLHSNTLHVEHGEPQPTEDPAPAKHSPQDNQWVTGKVARGPAGNAGDSLQASRRKKGPSAEETAADRSVAGTESPSPVPQDTHGLPDPPVGQHNELKEVEEKENDSVVNENHTEEKKSDPLLGQQNEFKEVEEKENDSVVNENHTEEKKSDPLLGQQNEFKEVEEKENDSVVNENHTEEKKPEDQNNLTSEQNEANERNDEAEIEEEDGDMIENGPMLDGGTVDAGPSDEKQAPPPTPVLSNNEMFFQKKTR
ncbi:dipeptidyl peptidase 3-like [Bacillus rossius redtenbacheri]|uniref:dipeptidyl peptidase 3-like n=1 Tax=Bacillus rossius redtenbacheri TaxID=93214 RepID=UPI002FDEEC28